MTSYEKYRTLEDEAERIFRERIELIDHGSYTESDLEKSRLVEKSIRAEANKYYKRWWKEVEEVLSCSC